MDHELDEDEKAEKAYAALLLSMFRERECDVAMRYFRIGLDKGFEKGLEMGLRDAMPAGVTLGVRVAYDAALKELYKARFGSVPAALDAALSATQDTATQWSWIGLFGTGTAEEIDAAVFGAKASCEAAGEP